MPQQGDIDWPLLNETIRRGRCILVLGPEAAVVPEYDNRPLSCQLAMALADELEDQGNVVDRADLAHVSQLYLNAVKSRTRLEMKVQEFLKPFLPITTELYRNLAGIPFRFCINLGLDRFYYNALEKGGKKPAFDYYNFREVRSIFLEAPKEETPLVFNLFGAVDGPQSMILTEQDMLEFLVKIVSRDPPLQDILSGEFADRENSFLFLGFRFGKWHARILLHILKTYDRREPSLALIPDETFDAVEKRCAAVYFHEACKFDFNNMSPLEFSRKLAEGFPKETVLEQVKDLLSVTVDAPTVFLCYRRMDRDAVLKVEEALHQNGINTWRDEQNLRGGDNWNQVIQDVLRKHVDYVVVLQTPNMVQQVKGYCKREIGIALDVQLEYDPFKYLIPTILNSCQGFDQLAPLQSEDLSQPEGLTRLIEIIRADWKKRQERKHGRDVA